jgi:hypothetical protein
LQGGTVLRYMRSIRIAAGREGIPHECLRSADAAGDR